MNDTKALLERIAVALEKIASLMESTQNGVQSYGAECAVNEVLVNLDNKKTSEEMGANEKIEVDVDILIERLAEGRIAVKTYPEREQENSELDTLSQFMGSRFSDIKVVYERIKRSLNSSSGVRLDMKTFSQSSVSSSCQFCTLLYNIAYLSEYKYLKSPRFCIYATPNRIPIAVNFLTGHWLEYFVKSTMLKVINSFPCNIEYSYIINPQIILPNGDDFELDVVFMINKSLYWIEAKTGAYQNYIDKYSKVAKMMNIMSKHMFMVLTEVPSQDSVRILEKSFGIQILHVEEFEKKMTEILSLEINSINNKNE